MNILKKKSRKKNTKNDFVKNDSKNDQKMDPKYFLDKLQYMKHQKVKNKKSVLLAIEVGSSAFRISSYRLKHGRTPVYNNDSITIIKFKNDREYESDYALIELVEHMIEECMVNLVFFSGGYYKKMGHNVNDQYFPRVEKDKAYISLFNMLRDPIRIQQYDVLDKKTGKLNNLEGELEGDSFASFNMNGGHFIVFFCGGKTIQYSIIENGKRIYSSPSISYDEFENMKKGVFRDMISGELNMNETYKIVFWGSCRWHMENLSKTISDNKLYDDALKDYINNQLFDGKTFRSKDDIKSILLKSSRDVQTNKYIYMHSGEEKQNNMIETMIYLLCELKDVKGIENKISFGRYYGDKNNKVGALPGAVYRYIQDEKDGILTNRARSRTRTRTIPKISKRSRIKTRRKARAKTI